MNCSTCGNDLPDDSSFCLSCGQPVSPRQPPSLLQRLRIRTPVQAVVALGMLIVVAVVVTLMIVLETGGADEEPGPTDQVGQPEATPTLPIADLPEPSPTPVLPPWEIEPYEVTATPTDDGWADLSVVLAVTNNTGDFATWPFDSSSATVNTADGFSYESAGCRFPEITIPPGATYIGIGPKGEDGLNQLCFRIAEGTTPRSLYLPGFGDIDVTEVSQDIQFPRLTGNQSLEVGAFIEVPGQASLEIASLDFLPEGHEPPEEYSYQTNYVTSAAPPGYIEAIVGFEATNLSQGYQSNATVEVMLLTDDGFAISPHEGNLSISLGPGQSDTLVVRFYAGPMVRSGVLVLSGDAHELFTLNVSLPSLSDEDTAAIQQIVQDVPDTIAQAMHAFDSAILESVLSGPTFENMREKVLESDSSECSWCTYKTFARDSFDVESVIALRADLVEVYTLEDVREPSYRTMPRGEERQAGSAYSNAVSYCLTKTGEGWRVAFVSAPYFYSSNFYSSNINSSIDDSDSPCWSAFHRD